MSGRGLNWRRAQDEKVAGAAAADRMESAASMPTEPQIYRLERELEENPDAARILNAFLAKHRVKRKDMSKFTYSSLLTWLIERNGDPGRFPLQPPEEEG